jgi:hypothetical protein
MKFRFYKPLNVSLWRSFWEATLFFAIYVAIGYFVSENDPLMLHHNQFYIVAFLSTLTLFYGIHSALYIMIPLGGVMYLFYVPFPLRFLLELLVLIFLWGIFYFYWVYHLRLAQSEKEVYKSKLNELANAFYALKTSHDQLELNYISRPVSLRRTLMEITACFKAEREGCFDELLVLLSKSFNITGMVIAVYEEGRYEIKSRTENIHTFDSDDPLIKKSVEANRPVYISQSSGTSRYLAVIPAVKDNKVIGLIAIESMPFMAFNSDNMIFIAFVFQYFMDTLQKTSLVRAFSFFDVFDEDFRFELARVHNMFEQYHIESSLVIFKTKSELQAYKLERILENTRRGLDVFASARIGQQYVIVVLAPFNVVSSIKVLEKRVLEAFEPKQRASFQTMSFPISKLALAWQYAKE